jgi:hypothetical protein
MAERVPRQGFAGCFQRRWIAGWHGSARSVARRWAFLILILSIVGMAFVPPAKPAPIVIRELRTTDLMVCAEYTTPTAPRKPNRSCVPAAAVAGWILQNGRLEECH